MPTNMQTRAAVGTRKKAARWLNQLAASSVLTGIASAMERRVRARNAFEIVCAFNSSFACPSHRPFLRSFLPLRPLSPFPTRISSYPSPRGAYASLPCRVKLSVRSTTEKFLHAIPPTPFSEKISIPPDFRTRDGRRRGGRRGGRRKETRSNKLSTGDMKPFVCARLAKTASNLDRDLLPQ